MFRKSIKLAIVMLASYLLVAILLPNTSFAAEVASFYQQPQLLTQEEAEKLNEKLEEISERNQFDVVVAVVDSLRGKTADLYALDFFEENGYGYGPNIDGAILLISMEYRDFGFGSFGYGIRVFTPAGQAYLDKLFLPYLSKNQYYEAFTAFADAVDDFLAQAEKGQPYDEGNIPLTPAENLKYRLIGAGASLVLALIIALSVTGVWRAQLKSVKRDNYAKVYIRDNSMYLKKQRDIFLYRQMQRVRKESNSSSRGGGGGVSRSSSGRSATSHRGKF